MFLYTVLLFVGGFTTTLLAVSAACPIAKDRPITGC